MRHSEPPLPGFVLLLGALVQTVGIGAARAEDLPVVNDVDLQPLAAQILRVVEALDILGQPLAPADKAKIDKAIDSTDQRAGVQTLQEVVDRHCLIGIDINPESRVKAAQGPAAPRLVQNGWSVFLVKVHNEAGVTAELPATSPNAEPIYKQSTSSAEPKKSIRSTEIIQRWMDLAMFRDRPLKRDALGTGGSSTGSSRFTAATPASARRRSASTSARGRRTSAFAATSTSSSLATRRCRWCWTCATRTAVRRWPRSSSGTGWDGFIPRPAAGWRRTSSSTPRSIARAARACRCRPELFRSSTRAGPSTRRKPGRSRCPGCGPITRLSSSSAGSTWRR